MKYKLYTKSIRAWDAMLLAIDKARHSIYLEMYIFLDDTRESHDFIGKLQEKAAQGVQIVIIADAFGSKTLKEKTRKELRDANIEFLFFSHWLRHIHRKILVVDQKIAFIGGVNIGKRFASWNDLQLELHGMIIKRILKSFAYTYEMAGGKDTKILRYKKNKVSAKLRFWLVEHFPLRNIHSLKNHYVEKITGAQKSIQIVTPYLTPPRWLISLLDGALRRGVKVEILLPRKADQLFMNKVNYHYIHTLSKLGVDFFLVGEMTHAKLLLIDNQEGLIGSQNLDLLSFQINSEVGLFFKNKRLLQELQEVIKDWKSDSLKLEQHYYKKTYLDYLIFALAKLLRPIL